MKPARKSPGDNIAEFWQIHFKESGKVITKLSTYEFFTKTELYRSEDYQTFTACSGRMIKSTNNKNTKNKLYKIEPRSPEAVMFFQHKDANFPGRSINETVKEDDKGLITGWDTINGIDEMNFKELNEEAGDGELVMDSQS